MQTYTRKRRNEDENEQRSVEIDLINEPGSMREVWDFALFSLFECDGMFWAKQRNGDRPSRSMKNPHSRESERKTEKKSRVLFRKGAVFLKLLDYFRQLRQMKIKKLKRFSLYVEDSRWKYHRDAHVRSDSVVVSITSHESYTAESSSSSSMSCALSLEMKIYSYVWIRIRM